MAAGALRLLLGVSLTARLVEILLPLLWGVPLKAFIVLVASVATSVCFHHRRHRVYQLLACTRQLGSLYSVGLVYMHHAVPPGIGHMIVAVRVYVLGVVAVPR